MPAPLSDAGKKTDDDRGLGEQLEQDAADVADKRAQTALERFADVPRDDQLPTMAPTIGPMMNPMGPMAMPLTMPQ